MCIHTAVRQPLRVAKFVGHLLLELRLLEVRHGFDEQSHRHGRQPCLSHAHVALTKQKRARTRQENDMKRHKTTRNDTRRHKTTRNDTKRQYMTRDNTTKCGRDKEAPHRSLLDRCVIHWLLRSNQKNSVVFVVAVVLIALFWLVLIVVSIMGAVVVDSHNFSPSSPICTVAPLVKT